MLVDKKNACLMIFNLQKEFIPSLKNGQKLIDDCYWLADVAQTFNIPIIIFNHKDLGKPIESIQKIAKNFKQIELTNFSCLEDVNFKNEFEDSNIETQFLLAGSESHISVLQSAVCFKNNNKSVFVIGDAITSRNQIDHDFAIQRLHLLSVPVITKEMLFFEFLRYSEYPNYIDLSLKFLDGRYIRE